MSLDTILGWSIIFTLLALLSASLILPPLNYLERVVSLGGHRRQIRIISVVLGGVALWYALPPLVQALYRHL